MRQRINVKDTSLQVVVKYLNIGGLIICWMSVFAAVVNYIITSNAGTTILFALVTPTRYFFFDTAPQKEQKRPLSLDRAIPLTIFVRYLSKRFPIPQGGIIADIWGFILATVRAAINGYALLYFDTFTFAFSVRDDDILLNNEESIKLVHDDQRLNAIQKTAEKTDNEEQAEKLSKLYGAWQETRRASQIDEWNFPLRRYLIPADSRAELNEIGNSAIDDENQVDQLALAKAKKSRKR
ncbi:hypothetical protein FOD75_11300 (plasmid) [Limosilactobacillus reuteri]|uniref:Uncharacterized protein n=1 Tax=Limosilactobacillus reuteri TaxID=1598 RepID=A0A517D8H7_LIMRT|nr:hypothetical protein [Limosilactobacillus reuteri]QDR73670.1 hypothetical protein FOD75_11300 [Limosilactobacillus reuteri]